MQTVGAFHAKTHFSALLEEVERGKQVIITKHGRPVAKLVPATHINQSLIKQTIQQLKKFSQKNKLGNLDWKTLRDEGRR